MAANPNHETILGLDVGGQRIGVARAHLDAPFPGPLTTLENPDSFVADIVELAKSERAAAVVVGLPRNLSGQATAQTESVQAFGAELKQALDIPLYWMDEAVTSEHAEAELKKRGKPYAKGDIDALAATYILEDFIREHAEFARG